MPLTDLQKYATTAEQALDASAALIRDIGKRPLTSALKQDGSPVTNVDKAAEALIRDIISLNHPDHGIIGEEGDDKNIDQEFVWVIDPIDGTLPFMAGIPVYGTLLALLYQDKPVVGLIDMPATGERWLGMAGIGTFHNRQPVRTRRCAALADAFMSTSNPDFFSDADRPYLERMRAATQLNIYGASCMAYAQLASGRIDVGFDVSFDIFDYLALVPVIVGAGGLITDWQGRPLTKQSGDRFVASGDRRVHEQALELLA